VAVLALMNAEASADHPDSKAQQPENEEERAPMKAFGDATRKSRRHGGSQRRRTAEFGVPGTRNRACHPGDTQ